MPSLCVKLSLYQQSVGWEEANMLTLQSMRRGLVLYTFGKKRHSSKQRSGQTRSPTTIPDVLAPPIPHFQMSAINHLTGELTMDCNFIGVTIYSTLKV